MGVQCDLYEKSVGVEHLHVGRLDFGRFYEFNYYSIIPVSCSTAR